MSGQFLNELVLRAGPEDGAAWKLVNSLIYRSEVPGVKEALGVHVIVVPAGFETDLASVPRLPFIYLVAGGCANEPAVVHDYLYSEGKVPREVADAVFREAMEACRVPAWRRWMMWAGVRVGGGSHYGNGQQPNG